MSSSPTFIHLRKKQADFRAFRQLKFGPNLFCKVILYKMFYYFIILYKGLKKYISNCKPKLAKSANTYLYFFYFYEFLI